MVRDLTFLKLYDSGQFIVNISFITRTIAGLSYQLIGMDKYSTLSNLADWERYLGTEVQGPP